MQLAHSYYGEYAGILSDVMLRTLSPCCSPTIHYCLSLESISREVSDGGCYSLWHYRQLMNWRKVKSQLEQSVSWEPSLRHVRWKTVIVIASWVVNELRRATVQYWDCGCYRWLMSWRQSEASWSRSASWEPSLRHVWWKTALPGNKLQLLHLIHCSTVQCWLMLCHQWGL